MQFARSSEFSVLELDLAINLVLEVCHSVDENRWEQVFAFGHGVGPGYPQLHVFKNSFFMGMWDSKQYVLAHSSFRSKSSLTLWQWRTFGDCK